MNIKQLIDEHIHPLTLAITNGFDELKGVFQTMTDRLDTIKADLDGLKTDLRDARTRSDALGARLDALKKSVDEHPNVDTDPRLQAISDEIDSIRTDAAAIAPATPPADAGSGTATTGNTPPADSSGGSPTP